MIRKQNNPYQDPKITYPIQDLGLAFSDYISINKKIVAENRLDLDNNPDLIINTNTPFEMRPDAPKYGALLIHGLLDSAFILRDVGKELYNQGLLVRSLLLPGHGTVPGGLLNVKHEDWTQAVRYGINSFKNEVDKIFLVGFSLGGALSIQAALQKEFQNIAGLILLAPVLQIKSKFAFMSGWLKFLKWVYKNKEIDYAKYTSITFNAVYQTYSLIQKIQNNTITQPQFFALPLDDKTVESQATLNYFSQNKNPKNKMILYTHDKTPPKDSRIITRAADYPKNRILNISHVGFPVAPQNPHYGQQGDYPLASRSANTNYFYDEILLPNDKHRRLTYNPDFDFMMQSILKFIAEV